MRSRELRATLHSGRKFGTEFLLLTSHIIRTSAIMTFVSNLSAKLLTALLLAVILKLTQAHSLQGVVLRERQTRREAGAQSLGASNGGSPAAEQR